MSHFHAIVWIDHSEAKIFHFNAEEADKMVIHPDHPHRHLHHKAGSVGAGKAKEDAAFFTLVAGALRDIGEALVVGPGAAKLEFVKFLQTHRREIASKIRGLETVDHPSDGQLVAFARKYFKADDHMTPQRVDVGN